MKPKNPLAELRAMVEKKEIILHRTPSGISLLWWGGLTNKKTATKVNRLFNRIAKIVNKNYK